jgi:hypothetical protein
MTRTTVHRSTSSINHHRIISAVAAAGLVGTLLAATPVSASAMPGRGDPPAGPAPVVTTHGHYVPHGCFMTPHTWSVELGGPLPVCYTYVP